MDYADIRVYLVFLGFYPRFAHIYPPWMWCNASRHVRRGILGRVIANAVCYGVIGCRPRVGRTCRREGEATEQKTDVLLRQVLPQGRPVRIISFNHPFYSIYVVVTPLSSALTSHEGPCCPSRFYHPYWPLLPLRVLPLSLFFPFPFFLHALYILSCFVVFQ